MVWPVGGWVSRRVLRAKVSSACRRPATEELSAFVFKCQTSSAVSGRQIQTRLTQGCQRFDQRVLKESSWRVGGGCVGGRVGSFVGGWPRGFWVAAWLLRRLRAAPAAGPPAMRPAPRWGASWCRWESACVGGRAGGYLRWGVSVWVGSLMGCLRA